MKSVLFAAVMSMGFFAGACPSPEAQFTAIVSKVTPSFQVGLCQIQFSQIKTWSENPLCPLDVEQAFTAPITTANCDYLIGDTASGVLVLTEGPALRF